MYKAKSFLTLFFTEAHKNEKEFHASDGVYKVVISQSNRIKV